MVSIRPGHFYFPRTSSWYLTVAGSTLEPRLMLLICTEINQTQDILTVTGLTDKCASCCTTPDQNSYLSPLYHLVFWFSCKPLTHHLLLKHIKCQNQVVNMLQKGVYQLHQLQFVNCYHKAIVQSWTLMNELQTFLKPWPHNVKSGATRDMW